METIINIYVYTLLILICMTVSLSYIKARAHITQTQQAVEDLSLAINDIAKTLRMGNCSTNWFSWLMLNRCIATWPPGSTAYTPPPDKAIWQSLNSTQNDGTVLSYDLVNYGSNNVLSITKGAGAPQTILSDVAGSFEATNAKFSQGNAVPLVKIILWKVDGTGNEISGTRVQTSVSLRSNYKVNLAGAGGCTAQLGCGTYDSNCLCTGCINDTDFVFMPINRICCSRLFNCNVVGEDCRCTTCQHGYRPVLPERILCESCGAESPPARCSDYDSCTDTCFICESGYEPSPSIAPNNSCQLCTGTPPTGCALGAYNACTDTCSICVSPYILVGGTCVNCPVKPISHCQGQIYDADNCKCLNCNGGRSVQPDGTCGECAHIQHCKNGAYDEDCKCTDCNGGGAPLADGTCGSCSVIDNCGSVNDDCTCATCNAGYELSADKTSCIACTGPISNCTLYSECTNKNTCLVCSIGTPTPPNTAGNTCAITCNPTCTGGKTCTATNTCTCPSDKPNDCGGTCQTATCAPICNTACTGGKICSATNTCTCPSDKPNDCGGTCQAVACTCPWYQNWCAASASCLSNLTLWTAPNPCQCGFQCLSGGCSSSKTCCSILQVATGNCN